MSAQSALFQPSTPVGTYHPPASTEELDVFDLPVDPPPLASAPEVTEEPEGDEAEFEGYAGSESTVDGPDHEPPALSSVSLRPHQIKTVKAVLQQFSSKNQDCVRRTLVVKATGTGKSTDATELARRAVSNGHHVLWLIPPGPPIDGLAKQACRSLARVGLTPIREQESLDAMPIFLEREFKEKQNGTGRGQVIVASVPTLKGKRLQRWVASLNNPMLLLDEAHHAPAASVQNVIKAFPNSYLVGFTATPKRADGKPLGKTFESLADTYSMADAVADGWLAPPLYLPIQTKPKIDLRNIRISVNGDFNDHDLETMLIDNMSRIVSELKPAIVGRKALLFTPTIYAAFSLSEALRQVGVRAEYVASMDIHGKPFPKGRVDELVRQLDRREIDTICNPILLSEGFDAPCIDAVGICRPVKSPSLYTQMCGRGSRLHPGKQNFLIIDLACEGHDLAGPIDLLSDDNTPTDVATKAKGFLKSGEENDPLKALARAHEEHSLDLSRRIQVQERAPVAERKVYNPLAALEVAGWKPRAQEGNWYGVKPIDPTDKKFLDATFNKKKRMLDTDSLSFYAAKEIKSLVLKRRQKHLCTFGQMALLVANGMSPKEALAVRFDEVNAVLAALRGAGSETKAATVTQATSYAHPETPPAEASGEYLWPEEVFAK